MEAKKVTKSEAKKAADVLSTYAKQQAKIAAEEGRKATKHAVAIGKNAVTSMRKRFHI